jgi:hypothetical protein
MKTVELMMLLCKNLAKGCHANDGDYHPPHSIPEGAEFVVMPIEHWKGFQDTMDRLGVREEFRKVGGVVTYVHQATVLRDTDLVETTLAETLDKFEFRVRKDHPAFRAKRMREQQEKDSHGS